MDSLTHIFLGAAVAQSLFGKRLGRPAFLVGALAATVPDFDVFIFTGDSVRDHLLHRTFMHALLLVPLLAGLAILPFLSVKRLRLQWPSLYGAAVLACLTHTMLDTLTSYGTMIFWPFTQRRYALDVIAAADPAYTLILVIGTVLALRRQTARPARIALVVSMAYLGFAAWQHHRAVETQRELIALRGQTQAENPRVLPQVGAVINFRSIYVFDGQIYADGIRIPPLGAARIKTGSHLARVRAEDIPSLAVNTLARERFKGFADLADGFIARIPGDPQVIGDMRYTALPEGFEPVWGVSFEGSGPPAWQMFVPEKIVSRMWRDLFRPVGYLPASAVRG